LRRYLLTIIGYFLFLSCSLNVTAETGTEKNEESHFTGNYAISLAASVVPFSSYNVTPDSAFDKYRLYTSEFEKDGKSWYRLRLGFFTTKEAADKVHKILTKRYPGSWITKVSEQEKKQSSSATIFSAPANVVALPSTPPLPQQQNVAPQQPEITDEKLAQYMEEARQSMAGEDYSRAITIYTRVLEYPDHPYQQDALEYLGLARERKKQFAHAKADYEKYLTLYPKGEGADRVRQRLAGLITATVPAQAKLREEKQRKETSSWQTYSSLAQYYRHDASTTDTSGTTVNQSLLSTDLDVSSRLRNSDYDIRGRFTGGYDLDFLDNNGDESRITSLYFEATDRQRGLFERVGRQSQSSGGVLGRFDGLLFGYHVTPVTRINIVAGYPVEFFNLDAIRTDKKFYGISFDFGTFANAWDFNTFVIQQNIDGILDRKATGGEIRYFKDNRSLLALVDYDISYQALNTVVILGNWIMPDNTTFNFVIDQRKSPILTTSNALLGQPVSSISELLTLFSEDEIRQLAVDRTPDSRSYTIGASRPLDSRFQISGDVTLTNLSSTPASGGVEAFESTGNDYFYSLQLIGNSLIKEGDLGILGLRYADTSSATTSTLSINSRYPVNSVWRVNPMLRIDRRVFIADDSLQWTYSPSVRVNYRWHRNAQFELELGGEWSNHDFTDTTEKFSAYFLNAGYRLDF